MLRRLILVIGSLVCVSILTFKDYNQWQDNLVTSSLKVSTSKKEWKSMTENILKIQNLLHIFSEHKQGSQGHSVPKCDHLH